MKMASGRRRRLSFLLHALLAALALLTLLLLRLDVPLEESVLLHGFATWLA